MSLQTDRAVCETGWSLLDTHSTTAAEDNHITDPAGFAAKSLDIGRLYRMAQAGFACRIANAGHCRDEITVA
jgi:hypothetical protein